LEVNVKIARMSFLALGGLVCAAGLAQRAQAQTADTGPTRLREAPVTLQTIDRLHVTKQGRVIEDTRSGLVVTPSGPAGGGLEGGGGNCQQIASRESSNFQPGTYAAQGGFGQGEVYAVSYVIPAAAFPIKIDLIETLLATMNATSQTITQYSILVWDGTPATGTVVFEFASDDLLLQHMRVGPGTAGTQLQFSIDPGDPEQIIIGNQGGSSTFSIGIRINQHNAQTSNPCTVAPPTCCNAFPVTDNTQSICNNYSQLSSVTHNWLFALNCGQGGCPPQAAGSGSGVWARFNDLQADVNIPGFGCLSGCRPRGDWVIRATWSSISCQPGLGACCLPTGGCEIRLIDDCIAANGTYQGDGVDCSAVNCPQPMGACCFGTSCINLTSGDCTLAGGTYLGNGTLCSGSACPTGACCLTSGACVVATSAACTAQGGLFRGVGATCGTANCPPPIGACCLANGNCLVLSSTNCALIAGSRFAGGGTNCATGCRPPCRPDFNRDGVLDPDDLADYISCFFSNPPCAAADYNGDALADPDDLADFISAFFAGC